MYKLVITGQFKKDLKKVIKNPKNDQLTRATLKMLQQDGVAGIPDKMLPHRLKGNFKDLWECHIKPDLLIIWFQFESPNVIRLVRIGSHSELFGR
ncbi:type II toxin-antitoxin system YafQ family toxin [Flagellimonas sp.]|uniref:type II toxin-antitoxin system RelE/ParE family toxin n=1 Tax=Flagellimonas sp. TaxID=2058762 RepID=UPI003B5A7614